MCLPVVQSLKNKQWHEMFQGHRFLMCNSDQFAFREHNIFNGRTVSTARDVMPDHVCTIVVQWQENMFQALDFSSCRSTVSLGGKLTCFQFVFRRGLELVMGRTCLCQGCRSCAFCSFSGAVTSTKIDASRDQAVFQERTFCHHMIWVCNTERSQICYGSKSFVQTVDILHFVAFQV